MGQIPRIPQRKNRDPVTADDQNRVARAVNALSSQSGDNPDSLGSVYYPRQAFQPYGLKSSGGTWEVKVTPGYIIENYLNLSPAVKEWVPEIGSTPLTDTTPPKLTVTDGDIVSLIFDTDSKGRIDGTTAPRIEVDPATTMTHHYPNSPISSPQVGLYKIKLFEIDSVNSVLKVKNIFHVGNYYWTNQLIEIENVGSEEEVYRGFDDSINRHKLRTLVGTAGTEPSAGANETKVNLFIKAEEDVDIIRFTGVAVVPSPSGATGALKIKDPDGAIVRTLMTWTDGLIDTSGDVFLTSDELEICGGTLDVLKTTL